MLFWLMSVGWSANYAHPVSIPPTDPDTDSTALLHMINTHTQTCYIPNWHGEIDTNEGLQTEIQTHTAWLSLDTCFSLTPHHTGAHLACKCTLCSRSQKTHGISDNISINILTPAVSKRGRGGGWLQVDYLTAIMEETATLLACLHSAAFSLRYYSSYLKEVQLCAWNICLDLLRLGKLPIKPTSAGICLYLCYV